MKKPKIVMYTAIILAVVVLLSASIVFFNTQRRSTEDVQTVEESRTTATTSAARENKESQVTEPTQSATSHTVEAIDTAAAEEISHNILNKDYKRLALQEALANKLASMKGFPTIDLDKEEQALEKWGQKIINDDKYTLQKSPYISGYNVFYLKNGKLIPTQEGATNTDYEIVVDMSCPGCQYLISLLTRDNFSVFKDKVVKLRLSALFINELYRSYSNRGASYIESVAMVAPEKFTKALYALTDKYYNPTVIRNHQDFLATDVVKFVLKNDVGLTDEELTKVDEVIPAFIKANSRDYMATRDYLTQTVLKEYNLKLDSLSLPFVGNVKTKQVFDTGKFIIKGDSTTNDGSNIKELANWIK